MRYGATRGKPGTYHISYAPTPKQTLFHESCADEVLYGGAAGGGKSKAIVMDALFRCLQYPDSLAVIFRRTYRELDDTIIKESLGSYPPGIGRYIINDKMWRLPNGSHIQFRHCENPADMYKYAGVEIQWLYFDELTTFEEEIYDFLKTRLRVPKRLGFERGIVRSSSNPGGIGHGWVKSRFVDAGAYGTMVPYEHKSKTTGKTQMYYKQYIPSRAMDNPHITDAYIYELERKPDALRRALLHGDWDAFEGQVFTEFRDDPAHYADGLYTHVIDPFEVPLHWRRYRSLDWGYTRPFSVGWWAVAPDGRVYRYREWYGCKRGEGGAPMANQGLTRTPLQVAQGIVELEERERREGISFIGIADPSLFDSDTGQSKAEVMSTQGIHFLPGDNSRLGGKMQLHQRLAFDASGRPGLYVFSSCRDFIRTIPDLPYSTSKVEDVDTASEDHIYDETRYFLMAWPTGAREPTHARPTVYDPFHEGGRR